MNAKEVASLFYVPSGTYMLSHSVGCLPVSSEIHCFDRYIRPWIERGGEAWECWLGDLAEFNDVLAKLFNSEPHLFCPQTNLSSALTKILFSLPSQSHRNKIVFSERDFPSIGFVIRTFCDSTGFQPVIIPADRDLTNLEVWDDILGKDVYIALVTHVTSNNGQCLPVAEITALCRKREIYSIVDVAQSAGIVPINLTLWQADFMIGSCIKWLCGGSGAGYMWVMEKNLEDVKPNDVGWFSMDDPMAMDIHNLKLSEDARRFIGGTPSILPFTLATKSIRLINSLGINRIYKHNQAFLSRVISQLHFVDVLSPRKLSARGGTLVINFRNNEQAMQQLKNANVFCDLRKEGLRFSPHIYNPIDEADHLATLINHF